MTDGELWDNNGGVNYRLWTGFEALDAHMHLSGRGAGALGAQSLATAMASAGMVCGISSWLDNRALDRVDCAAARIFPLVWVRPGDTELDEVRARLDAGAVGLKLHPTVDGYPADDPALDPYIAIAEQAGCPVACHSAPGEADPDNIRGSPSAFPRFRSSCTTPTWDRMRDAGVPPRTFASNRISIWKHHGAARMS